MQQFENADDNAQDIPDSVWNIQNTSNELAFPNDIKFNNHPSFDELADAIEQVTEFARNMAARHVYDDQLWAYWNDGRMIVVYGDAPNVFHVTLSSSS